MNSVETGRKYLGGKEEGEEERGRPYHFSLCGETDLSYELWYLLIRHIINMKFDMLAGQVNKCIKMQIPTTFVHNDLSPLSVKSILCY